MWCGQTLARAMGLTAFLAFAAPALAQEAAPAPVASPILMIDQERLFVESAFGRAVLARETATASVLSTENAKIEAKLVAQELDLTERRATLSAEDFTALAEAFDAEVVRIRAEQDAKLLDLTRGRETDRQEFFRAAIPVLGDLLVERKAVAIIDKSALILALSAIDVTDAAIAKVDAALEAGGPATAPDPAAAPEPAPSSP
jgi:Skp family chaperone for outer membrane proteins